MFRFFHHLETGLIIMRKYNDDDMASNIAKFKNELPVKLINFKMNSTNPRNITRNKIQNNPIQGNICLIDTLITLEVTFN